MSHLSNKWSILSMLLCCRCVLSDCRGVSSVLLLYFLCRYLYLLLTSLRLRCLDIRLLLCLSDLWEENNSCSCLTRHESWENSHTNSHLSSLINFHATLVLVWPEHVRWEDSNTCTNSRLSTLINSHATLVLVWPEHESWEISHTNSRPSTLINSHANSCSPLTRTCELRKLSYKLSLVNSHQLSCNSCSRLTRT